jgi:hypothetical protein
MMPARSKHGMSALGEMTTSNLAMASSAGFALQLHRPELQQRLSDFICQNEASITQIRADFRLCAASRHFTATSHSEFVNGFLAEEASNRLIEVQIG